MKFAEKETPPTTPELSEDFEFNPENGETRITTKPRKPLVKEENSDTPYTPMKSFKVESSGYY